MKKYLKQLKEGYGMMIFLTFTVAFVIGFAKLLPLAAWYIVYQIAEGIDKRKRQQRFFKNMNEFDKRDNGTR